MQVPFAPEARIKKKLIIICNLHVWIRHEGTRAVDLPHMSLSGHTYARLMNAKCNWTALKEKVLFLC